MRIFTVASNEQNVIKMRTKDQQASVLQKNIFLTSSYCLPHRSSKHFQKKSHYFKPLAGLSDSVSLVSVEYVLAQNNMEKKIIWVCLDTVFIMKWSSFRVIIIANFYVSSLVVSLNPQQFLILATTGAQSHQRRSFLVTQISYISMEIRNILTIVSQVL